MEFLNQVLSLDGDYKALLNAVGKGRMPLVSTGLSLIHKSAVTAALCEHTGKKAVIITSDEAQANEIKYDINSLGLKCINFPSRDYCIGELTGYSREYEHRRIHTLSELSDGDFCVVTMSVEAAMQYTLPKEVLNSSRVELTVGKCLDMKELALCFTEAGYSRSELCEGAGQFSVRGGIVDIFPVNSPHPYRIEFWGDELDSISEFDILSQRRIESVQSITVSPATEIVYSPEKLIKILEE